MVNSHLLCQLSYWGSIETQQINKEPLLSQEKNKFITFLLVGANTGSQPQLKLLQLLLAGIRRGPCEQAGGLLGFGKGNDIPDG